MIVGQFALIVAAAFTSAAFYVTLPSSPHGSSDDKALLASEPSTTQLRHAGTLAMVGALLGALAFWQTSDWMWLAGFAAFRRLALHADRPQAYQRSAVGDRAGERRPS
jgi:hypothetical protein